MEFRFEKLVFRREKDHIIGRFLQVFEFQIPRQELDAMGSWSVKNGGIVFTSRVPATRFHQLIDKGLSELRCLLTKKPTTYVFQGSGIPLIGSIEFGIIDRGTNVIEVRPITGCNINCVYCSVNQDARVREFVVDKEYLIHEFRKLVAFKNCSTVEAHIGTQGEPTLYADLVDLVRGLKETPGITKVSIDTNGTLLTKKRIDELAAAGLTHVNLSLNAMDIKVAHAMAKAKTPHKKILDLCTYIRQRMELVLAPVLVSGMNDTELEPLIAFAKSLKTKDYDPKIFVQNFLPYKFGRNPAKQIPFDDFYARLKRLEQKHNITLICNKEIFDIVPAKSYPKKFRKGQVIKAPIVALGRLPNEVILARDNVSISVMNCKKKTGTVCARVIRTKHNIYLATTSSASL